MTALFADTFYWIALADSNDSAHKRALEITATYATPSIVTTDEVLTEYLNYFSNAPKPFRRNAAQGVQRLITSSVRVIPQKPRVVPRWRRSLRRATGQKLQPD